MKALASDKGCTPSQLALAWVLAQGRDIVPIPGTSSISRLEENTAAANVKLSASELDELDALSPKDAVSSARYAPEMAKLVNG